MTQVFGEIAAMYDDVRPGYPAEVLDAIVDFRDGTASVAELPCHPAARWRRGL